jgi:hypothetical protein
VEALAYTHMAVASEDAAAGIEYSLPELQLNMKKLPSSAWLGMAGVAVLFTALSHAAPASAAYVRTNGSCLKARYGPSLHAPVYTCVRNGARLAPIVGYRNGFAKLSTGRYVSAAYIGGKRRYHTSSRYHKRGRYYSHRHHYRHGGVGGRLLQIGSRGKGVRRVQSALGVRVDGIYGSQTKYAVKDFQARNGLLVDGVVGPQTRRYLF